MFIKVRVQNPGHSGRTRAKRRFANGVEYRLEVIDRDEDFFTDPAKQYGDMTKCNRAAFEAIKRDPAFSFLSSDETSVAISEEVLEGVRAHAAGLAAKLSDAEVEIARLKGELAARTKERDEAQFKVAELEEAAEAAAAGQAQAVDKAVKKAMKDAAKKAAEKPEGEEPPSE